MTLLPVESSGRLSDDPPNSGALKTVDTTTNWKPDPFGVHEFRFFSADGKPTLLVMDGGKRSYDKPPTDQTEGSQSWDQPEPSLMPDQQFTATRIPPPPPAPPATTPQPPPPAPPAAAAILEEPAPARDDETRRYMTRPESNLPPPRFNPVSTPPKPLGPEPTTYPLSPEVRQEQTQAFAAASGATMGPASAGSATPSEKQYLDNLKGQEQETIALSRPLKIAYCVVLGVLALSALGVLFVHLHHSDNAHSLRAVAPTTTTTSQPAAKASPVVLPSRLSPSAEVAADDLVTSWSMNNRLGALAVATPAAATTLFDATYASGLVISRGCSTSFSPIVCTYGPPGGASPTDPIYEIRVSQVAGGWYVSSVRIEN